MPASWSFWYDALPPVVLYGIVVAILHVSHRQAIGSPWVYPWIYPWIFPWISTKKTVDKIFCCVGKRDDYEIDSLSAVRRQLRVRGEFLQPQSGEERAGQSNLYHTDHYQEHAGTRSATVNVTTAACERFVFLSYC